MKQIKLCNVIEEGRFGGPHTRMIEVAKKLKHWQIDSILAYPKLNSSRLRNKIEKASVNSVQLPLRPLTKEKSGLILYCVCFFREIVCLYRYFKKEHLDLVHVSGGCWQFKGVIAGKLAKQKILWHLNDTKTNPLLKLFFKFLSIFFVDGIIVAGNRVKEYYITEMVPSNTPIYEIQAPVDTSFFSPTDINIKRNFLCGNSLNIVTIGNINPAKGFEYFIIMAAILKNHRNLNFYIVGPHLKSQKKYNDKLNSIISDLKIDNIVFTGPSDNIRRVLQETDIYICSSITEASPISVWEAMSMSKAIVSADVGDVHRFIENGVNGFIVPRCCPEKLAEKVKFFITNPLERESFGQKARKTAIENLDIEVIAKQHMEAYLDVIEQ